MSAPVSIRATVYAFLLSSIEILHGKYGFLLTSSHGCDDMYNFGC